MRIALALLAFLTDSLTSGNTRVTSYQNCGCVALRQKLKVSLGLAFLKIVKMFHARRPGRGRKTFFSAITRRAYEDKDAQETVVKRSGLHWIIVRPVILTNGPNTGRYKVLGHPKDWRSGTISRADVADFLLKQAQDSSYLGKTPVLTN
jgi:hypothetical protein